MDLLLLYLNQVLISFILKPDLKGYEIPGPKIETNFITEVHSLKEYLFVAQKYNIISLEQ